jgi:hypothetical protein
MLMTLFAVALGLEAWKPEIGRMASTALIVAAPIYIVTSWRRDIAQYVLAAGASGWMLVILVPYYVFGWRPTSEWDSYFIALASVGLPVWFAVLFVQHVRWQFDRRKRWRKNLGRRRFERDDNESE